MLRKNRSGSAAAVADQDLRQRLDKAIAERRFQTALDLAKQLYRYEATPENRGLLFQAHIHRAEQLREQGKSKDAATLLNNALLLADSVPERLSRLAEAFASCGNYCQMQSVLANVPGGHIEPAIFGKAADAAIRQGSAGRAQLPESLRGDFDRIRNAFVQLQAANDDVVRELLQGIGLQSPFLEWKLLLRGLLAYYHNDDERARENWQRLDHRRLPARLAAPFRFQIDQAYKRAQSADAQKALQDQMERLQSSPIMSGLRKIQSELVRHDNLNAAFREAEMLIPGIQQQAPEILPRVANIFYWQIIDRGEPADIGKYERLIGSPADDRQFHRMRSLILEQMPDYVQAHIGWQQFQEELAANSALWPNGEAVRACAMIWCRMGLNAEKQDQIVESTKNFRSVNFFREVDRPACLKPTAAQCYRKAAQLAPDWLDPHWQLFELLNEQGKPDPALKAGNDLLVRFPEHLPTLEAMADLQRECGNLDAAAQFLERAMHVNPLDRTVTSQLSDLYRLRGFKQFCENEFEEGRNSLQAALGLADAAQHFAVCCQWAAGEFRAGNLDHAESLLQKAATNEAERPALSAYLFAHCVLWKLPKALKAKFEMPFQEQLKQTSATPGEAVALVTLFARYQREQVEYFGQKTHQKKVFALVETTVRSEYTDLQMLQMGKHLLTLRAIRLLRKLTRIWERQFPKSPYPCLFEIESCLTGDSDRWPLWRLSPLLQKAKDLAEKLPASEEQNEILKLIEARQQQFHDLNPYSSFFESFMDEMDVDFDDDDEDDLW